MNAAGDGPRVAALRLHDWRCHRNWEAEPGPCQWVVLAGANGAGKTSVLEAIYATARGRSFRTADLTEVIRVGGEEAGVFLRSEAALGHVLGLGIHRGGRELRLDQESGASLAAVAEALPTEYVSGDAYRLVSGAPAGRRRFLDWVLFHVEPAFHSVWRAWHRAHVQRNALLRRAAPAAELAPWTPAMVRHGERLSTMREALVETLNAELAQWRAEPHLGPARLGFKRGWGGMPLGIAIERSAARERRTGRAVVGPQYDDWRLEAGGVAPAGLSRGQAKLVSLLLYRAQSRLLAAAGRPPLLLVDDLAADLDGPALKAASALLAGEGAQVWLSVLPRDAALPLEGEAARFHVEPGKVRRV